MPNVYIPHIATRFNHETQRVEQVFDFSAASMHGTPVTILDSNDNPVFLAQLTPKIRKALENFSEDDRLIAVGDPAVIGICCAIIGRRQRVINMLKWDRKLQSYTNVEVRP